MAKKREKVIHVEQKAPEGASDLEVMHPERVLVIAGKTVTMREYGFIEGLTLLPKLKPFIAAMAALMKEQMLPTIDGILSVFGDHHADLVQAIATAADVDADWVGKLSMQDGYTLAQLWWIVNGPFFMRTAVNQVRDERLVAEVRAGQTSTQPLSEPDTAPQPISDA